MQRIEHDKYNTTLEFDFLSEMVDYGVQPCSNKANRNQRDGGYEFHEVAHLYINKKTKKRYLNSLEWYGVPFKNINDLIKRGWVEGLSRAQKIMNEIELPVATSIRRKRSREDFGDELDIQAVYAGDLDRAWETTTKAVVSGTGTVTVYVDLCYDHKKTADEMFYKGAVAIRLVDALEQAGYRVRVIGYMHVWKLYRRNTGGVHNFLTTVVLKDYSETLDLSIMITTTGLSGFFRKTIFDVWYREERTVSKTLGKVNSWNPPEGPDGEVTLDITKCLTLNEAKYLLQSLINKVDNTLVPA